MNSLDLRAHAASRQWTLADSNPGPELSELLAIEAAWLSPR